MADGYAVGIVRAPSNGYWVLTSLGAVLPHAAPTMPSLKLTDQPAPVGTASPVPVLPVSADPATSTQPSAQFVDDCYTNLNPAECNTVALQDIDQARAGEGLGALVLPANYASLEPAQQVLAVANAERTSRGLSVMAENSYLDTFAQQGVIDSRDPQGPVDYGWGSNIAWGYATPLAADFGWMYDDGPGGDNIDCTTTVTSGCWGHRKNILAQWTGAAGAGYLVRNGIVSYSELFVDNY